MYYFFQQQLKPFVLCSVTSFALYLSEIQTLNAPLHTPHIDLSCHETLDALDSKVSDDIDVVGLDDDIVEIKVVSPAKPLKKCTLCKPRIEQGTYFYLTL